MIGNMTTLEARSRSAQNLPADGDWPAILKTLLGYAILAPSTHNTQPWMFSIAGNEIQLFADRRRWLAVSDPDQHELFISMGCALENLLVAAEHFGYGVEVDYGPASDPQDFVASVKFDLPGQPSRFRGDALFEAIPWRHTNRRLYKSCPISQADLLRLYTANTEWRTYLHMIDDEATKDKIDELIFYADAVLFADPDFRQERGEWVGQGMRNHSRLLSRAGQFAAAYLADGEVEAMKDSWALQSTPVLAMVSSWEDDRESQVRAGKAFEKIWLTATSLGIALQPMNQILRIPGLGAEVTRLIPAAHLCPQIMFRLGYAEPDLRHTARRPLEEVLLQVT